MNDTKEIVLFRTHLREGRSSLNLSHLRKCKYPVEILYDSTNKQKQDDCFNVSLDDIIKAGYPLASEEQIKSHAKNNMNYETFQMWYNVGYMPLLYWKEHPEYDYYWSIEYDVYYNGDWNTFFDSFNNADADFIGLMNKVLDENTHTFNVAGKGKNDDYKEFIKSFGIVHRYSNRLLEKVDELLQCGEHMFYEILFPTIAKEYGMSVKDVNDFGNHYRPATVGLLNIDDYYMKMTNDGDNKLFHRVK